jgi:hypothetical protein
MFASPYFTQLHTKIVRFITPYNTADSTDDLAIAQAFLTAAAAQHFDVLVAFYHSRSQPTKLPSTSTYLTEIKRFMADFPEVTEYQPWNEANRSGTGGGIVREPNNGSYANPSARQAASYYLALKSACPTCTNVGLDVLDSQSISSTLRYIRLFKHYVGAKNVPRIWGLHNYSDTNRHSSRGTRDVLKAISPGELWLTETGGIVKLGSSFHTSYTRAANALKYMFSLARSNRRIKRLYIFQWTGGNPAQERFDAGLVNPPNGLGKPRCGWYVVAHQLIHKAIPKSCHVR